MSFNNGKPVQILLVEDNSGDVILVKEAFREARVLNEIHVVVDGVEAMDFLHHQGEFVEAPRPDLILLDLNLPRKTGMEVLAEIKSDPELKTIPVIILTTSKEEKDIKNSYKLHANSFITKPVRFEQFLEAMKSLETFWFQIVHLPPR
jgi:two-component system, chemotaxis family, response regulator Rcp1